MDVAVTHLKGCPLTKGDVQAAEDIYGPNLGSLKGKTVDRPNPHVQAGVDHVPNTIMDVHQSVTLAIDVMFINKVLPLVDTLRKTLQITLDVYYFYIFQSCENMVVSD